MLWKLLAAALATSLAWCPMAATAGPFGFSMGDPISRYRARPSGEPGVYIIANPPFPRPDMDFYSVVATPQNGVCKIIVATKTNESDPYGAALRSDFSGLQAALASKYGAPSDTYDLLKNGAVWGQDREFTMSLKENDRILSTFWKLSSADQIEGVATIMLVGKALSADANYVSLSYEFANFDLCIDELHARADSAL